MVKGMVYIFTGEGKGKTSAALGVTLRMLMNGKKVVWISWFKNKDWNISEMKMSEYFPDLLKMVWAGQGFYIQKSDMEVDGVKMAKVNKGVAKDFASPDAHRMAAIKAMDFVREVLRNNEKPDVIVMDEAIQAIKEGLLNEDDVIEVIEERGATHIIMTGRDAGVKLRKAADLVTEMKKIKHPYDSGKMAVKGLDY